MDRSIPAPGTEPGMQVYRRSLRLPDTWVQRVRQWYPEQVTAAQIRADPSGYILCMSFFEEQHFELRRLQNWLDRFHFTPLGLTDAPSPYHTSGHISGPELLEVIRRIAPGAVIPVHTSTPNCLRVPSRVSGLCFCLSPASL